jgi:hypothetical protein
MTVFFFGAQIREIREIYTDCPNLHEFLNVNHCYFFGTQITRITQIFKYESLLFFLEHRLEKSEKF